MKLKELNLGLVGPLGWLNENRFHSIEEIYKTSGPQDKKEEGDL